MTAKKFLIEKINQLVIKYPNIKVSYQFDDMSETHIVKVVPKSVYHDDLSYQDDELEIYKEFSDLFPDASLVFISGNDLIDIDSPEYVKTGKEYGFNKTTADIWGEHNIGINFEINLNNKIMFTEVVNFLTEYENFETIITDFTSNIKGLFEQDNSFDDNPMNGDPIITDPLTTLAA